MARHGKLAKFALFCVVAAGGVVEEAGTAHALIDEGYYNLEGGGGGGGWDGMYGDYGVSGDYGGWESWYGGSEYLDSGDISYEGVYTGQVSEAAASDVSSALQPVNNEFDGLPDSFPGPPVYTDSVTLPNGNTVYYYQCSGCTNGMTHGQVMGNANGGVAYWDTSRQYNTFTLAFTGYGLAQSVYMGANQNSLMNFTGFVHDVAVTRGWYGTYNPFGMLAAFSSAFCYRHGDNNC